MGFCCIGNCCVFNCCVGNCCVFDFNKSSSCCVGYSPGPSKSEAHATKIANELAEMKEKLRKSSEKSEKEILDQLNQSLDDLIKEIEKINQVSLGGKKLNINIRDIHQKNDALKNEVIGSIASVYDSRLVLTDKELSIILAEYDDAKRSKNFDKFIQKLRSESIKLLDQKIDKTVKQQHLLIKNTLDSRLAEVKTTMDNSKKELDEIIRIKESDGSKLEGRKKEYIYQHGICDLLSDELEA